MKKLILVLFLIGIILLFGCSSSQNLNDTNSYNGINLGDNSNQETPNNPNLTDRQALIEELKNVDWTNEDNLNNDTLCNNALPLFFGSWTGNYSKETTTTNFYDNSLNTYHTEGSFNFSVSEKGEITGHGTATINGTFGPDKGENTYKKTTLENKSFEFDIKGNIDCVRFIINQIITSEKLPTNYYEYYDNQLGKTGSSRIEISPLFYELGMESKEISPIINPVTGKLSIQKSEEGLTYSLNISRND